MPVTALSIKNFKSIRTLRFNCKKVNLLIGRPNTGKSNILEAIGVLSHIGHGERIADFVRFEKMTELFHDNILDEPISIGFDDNTVRISFRNGQFHGTYETPVDQAPARRHAITVFRYPYGGGQSGGYDDLKVFKFYRFRKDHAFPNVMSEFLKPPHGDNLLHVIMTRKRLRRITRELFSEFGYRLVFSPQDGRIEIQKELEDILFSFPYSLASETLQRLVFYLAAIYSNEKSIVTFEEPEAHAFPFYTKYLAERIALDKNKNQYFITTHNPYLLTSILEKTISRNVAVFLTYFENYETKIKPLTRAQKEEILELGEAAFFNIKSFLKNSKGK